MRRQKIWYLNEYNNLKFNDECVELDQELSKQYNYELNKHKVDKKEKRYMDKMRRKRIKKYNFKKKLLEPAILEWSVPKKFSLNRVDFWNDLIKELREDHKFIAYRKRLSYKESNNARYNIKIKPINNYYERSALTKMIKRYTNVAKYCPSEFFSQNVQIVIKRSSDINLLKKYKQIAKNGFFKKPKFEVFITTNIPDDLMNFSQPYCLVAKRLSAKPEIEFTDILDDDYQNYSSNEENDDYKSY